jgi:hypothetical protein
LFTGTGGFAVATIKIAAGAVRSSVKSFWIGKYEVKDFNGVNEGLNNLRGAKAYIHNSGASFDGSQADVGRVCKDLEGNDTVITDSGIYPCVTTISAEYISIVKQVNGTDNKLQFCDIKVFNTSSSNMWPHS